jgi:dihydrofolate synthase/folylpolyglutamate synthase
MPVNYAESLKYLYALQKFGMKLGLTNIKLLLKSVGNPERRFASIHIAGTNGKGSTASMIASILQAAGYKVGLYTSPHLVSFDERIRINGQAISIRRVSVYAQHLRQKVDELKCTFFEATTAMAFLYFADEQVDIAVIETGLGGRLDATNVLRPLLSVITNISLEHTEHLGSTLSSVAREKAGIMKKGIPCLVGELQPAAGKSIQEMAIRKGAKLLSSSAVSDCEMVKEDLSGIRLNLKTARRKYNNLFVSLGGGFQAENARLTVLAAELIGVCDDSGMHSQNRFRIKPSHIYAGLKRVRQNTGFRGRLEVVRNRPRVILDVAHNADAAKQLTEALEKLSLRNLLVVFGVMKDKRYEEMIQHLSRISAKLIAVRPRIDRALAARVITRVAQRLGKDVVNAGSVRKGIGTAMKLARKSDTILVTGSHYIVGEVLQALEAYD